MPVVLVVDFQIKPDHILSFEQAMTRNAQQSLDQEPGCRVFDVCRDPDDDASFFLYEVYDDEASVQAHMQSPHFLAMDAATADWVASKSVRKLSKR